MAEERDFEAECYRLKMWLRVLVVVLAVCLGVIGFLLATREDSVRHEVRPDHDSVWTESFIERNRQLDQLRRKSREARAQLRRSRAQERESEARRSGFRRAIRSRDPEKAQGILDGIPASEIGKEKRASMQREIEEARGK